MELLTAEKIGIGTWPDWIAAVGNVLAFGGLAFGLWWEIRQRRLDQAAAATQQARLVFVRPAISTDPDDQVAVQNASSAPIFDVTVDYLAGRAPVQRKAPPGLVTVFRLTFSRRREWYWTMVGGLPREPGVEPQGNRHVDGGETVAFRIPPRLTHPGMTARRKIRSLDGYCLWFTDANGRRWLRVNHEPPVLVK